VWSKPPLGNAESNMIVMWVTRFVPLARASRALCS